jgi:hypothetical protein
MKTQVFFSLSCHYYCPSLLCRFCVIVAEITLGDLEEGDLCSESIREKVQYSQVIFVLPNLGGGRFM